MNQKFILFFLHVFLFSTTSFSFAQIATDIDSRKIINKGIEFHDEKKYTEAIAEFTKINRNDTNFVLAVLELANSYIANGQDSLALISCNQALYIPSSFAPNVLLYKANALDNLKKSDEAVKVYEEGIKKYPLNNSFYFELGILKYRKEQYSEAHDLFAKSIKYNPFHAGSHFQMGNLAIKQGKLISAMLAWSFYLLIDNSSGRAKGIISELEKMAKNEYEFKDAVKLETLSEQDDFSELESLVKSKVALSAKYKSKTDLKYNLTKQLQLIFEKLELSKEDKGFYMQFYTPFFEELNKKGFFEPYAYISLSGMDIKEIDKWISKNKSEKDNLITWALTYIGENASTFETTLNGKKVIARHWYGSNKISAVGNENAAKQNIGYWNFYYSNAVLKSEGAFNDKDQRDGTWKFYYPTGLLKSIENYTNGEVTGIVQKYYENGSISTNKNFSNNLLDGLQTTYYPTGVVNTTYEYKTGKENGKEIAHSQNGKLKYDVQVTNDKYEGEFIQYYDNGHIKEKSFFKESEKIGKTLEYYDLPEKVIKNEGSYDKGKFSGEWKSYHNNGNLKEVGSFNKDGNKNGLWKSFYDNNILKSEENYSNGKSDGFLKYYDDSAKLTEEYIFKNDILQEYKAYKPNGEIIFQNKKDGKRDYDILQYYPNGNMKKEGKIRNGNSDGVWKYYNLNGYISEETPYVDGKKHGKNITYYENGKIKSELNYVNGETDGYYKEYYKNEQLQKEGAYIQDKEVGPWNYYYKNGKLQRVNYYKDAEIDGWQQHFAVNGKLNYEDFVEFGYFKKRISYDTTGKVFEEITFDKGTCDMELKYYNGKTASKTIYKNDFIQGNFVAYYPNGKVKASKNFIDGAEQGEVKFFYPDGKIEWLQNFVNGKKHGKQTEYDENGNVERETDYIYGIQTGKSIYYFPNKKIEKEYLYKDGNVNGNTTLYNESGELIILRTYKDDYINSYSYNDRTGILVAPVEIINETGTVKAYYKNGVPSIEYTLKNGALTGSRTVYYENARIREVKNYTWNEQEGVSKYYYASGKLKAEENWNQDVKEGKCIYFHENGKIKSEQYFVNGQEHGTFKYYDVNGALTKTYFYYNGDLIDAL